MKRWLWLCLGMTGCIDLDGDRDGDGYLDHADCGPDDPLRNPDAPERCNGLDDDCDGETDEDVGPDAPEWYADADGDGFGVLGTASIRQCDQPVGYTDLIGDCDDTRADRHPGTVWFIDEDGDQYGDASGERKVQCWGEENFVANDGDCDDTDPEVNPRARELCNGLDDNCDGRADEEDHEGFYETFYADEDGDGFGTVRTGIDGNTVEACEAPSGYVDNARDCDDGDGTIHPEAERVCGDGIDNACDELEGRLVSDETCHGELTDADAKVVGAAAGDGLGATMAVLRDLYNPDDDAIAVGAPGHRLADGSMPGGVWVFRVADVLAAGASEEWVDPAIDASTGRAPLGVLIQGDGLEDQLSSGLSGSGDFDGDGLPDLLIGAHKYSTNGMDAEQLPAQDGTAKSGAVFVVPGAELLLAEDGDVIEAVDHLVAYGGWQADWLGGSAVLADVNGDGVSDVLAGTTGLAGTNGSGSSLDLVGGVAVIFGDSSGADPIAIDRLAEEGRGVVLTGVDEKQYTVGQFVDAGDFTGDGIADVAVGVVKSDSEKGAVYLIEGPLEDDMTLSDAGTSVLHGPDPNGSFGSQVVIQEDNGCADLSGHAMLYVGARSTSEEGYVAGGALYAFELSALPGVVSDASTVAGGKVIPSAPYQGIGTMVRAGGVIDDDDCIPDLLMSGWPDGSEDRRGHVLAFHGPLDTTLTDQDPRAYLAGEELYARAGITAAFARAPSLGETVGYPGAHDAIVVGSDRFDWDSNPDGARENAGAVHIFSSLGY